MSLLDRLLAKRGIAKIEDLTQEEQKTYQHWKSVLTEEQVTVETLREFCEQQIKIIEGKCDGVNPLTNLQQACLHVYINIIKAIDAPLAERESVERLLQSLINQ